MDESAARVLARLADGALRDGLSLLDQCASATVGELTAQRVYACLGIAGEQTCGELMGYLADHNTRAALELFNRLYADGKDVAAVMDELACLTRDLLVMKTAAGAGISMLSGVASEQEVKNLLPKLSSGTLVRAMSVLQETMAGFSRSANRRMDAELCIITLCQPELQLDMESLNARLTRIEEQLQTGDFTAPVKAAKVVAQEQPAAQEDDDRPPMPGDDDAPPEQEGDAAPAQAPSAFWTDLVANVRKEVKPPASGFFVATPNAPVRGALRGNQLFLVCDNPFVAETLNKPEILEVVGRKASMLLQKAVVAKVADRSAKPQNSAKMEQLLSFGRAHSDIVKIKE